MDNSPRAAEIIAEHERDVARLRRGLRRIGWAAELLVLFLAIYGAGMVVVGLIS